MYGLNAGGKQVGYHIIRKTRRLMWTNPYDIIKNVRKKRSNKNDYILPDDVYFAIE